MGSPEVSRDPAAGCNHSQIVGAVLRDLWIYAHREGRVTD
jgi:hypothetical protein